MFMGKNEHFYVNLNLKYVQFFPKLQTRPYNYNNNSNFNRKIFYDICDTPHMAPRVQPYYDNPYRGIGRR